MQSSRTAFDFPAPITHDGGHGAVARYGFAIGCVAAGWLCREAFSVAIGPTALPFVAFFPAVAIAGWYGGLGPGFLSVVLGAATAWWSFIEPTHSFSLGKADDFTLLTAFAVGAAVIVISLASMHRAQQRLIYEAKLRRRIDSQWAATLAGIGDGVIAVDMEKRVTFINAEAERVTGWTSADALGRPLTEIFHILNETTRRTVENPVDKAMREGTVVGLANHTILITKQGAETPIDDSAAPIRDVDGDLAGVVLVFRDVAEQRTAMRARAQLAAIIEHSGDAIVTKDLRGIIQTWNAGAERLFGYRADEIIGKPVTTLFPPDRLDEEVGILRRLHEGLPFERFETIRVTKDGRHIPVSLSISPIRDDDGRIIGASKIIHDISEIVTARNSAQRASQMKDEFLATLSHELRTPLNAVLGYATLMRMGNLTPAETDEAIEIIERNARAQAQLIEDLLDMNRIVSGKIAIELRIVQAADVVSAALNTVRPTAEAKGVRLQPDLESGAFVRADPNRLQQVVWNLLTNAVKFTPSGGEVRVAVRTTESQVEIIVSDTGQGIEPAFLPHVFERFRQADASSTRRHGGLGLGLAIVRHLVELHAGSVRAASRGTNAGSEFVVTLPRVSDGDRRRDSVTSGLPSGVAGPNHVDLSAVRALVVDDDHDAVALVERTLRRCGADVATAFSAGEALGRLADRDFDVLISDLSMPGEDGFSLIREIRKNERGRHMSAVALTALAAAADRDRALAAGFDLHVAKPIEAEKLPALVAELARKD